MAPAQFAPIVNTLRFAIGLVFLATLRQPEQTHNYRLRYWTAIPALAVIAAIGLRPAFAHSPIEDWATYGSVFQAIFNFGVILVLLVRYRLYMPHER